MNLLEPRRKNPTVFRLGEKQSYAVIGEEFDPEPISLDKKVDIGGDSYGMTIYTADGARQYYGTQSEIIAAEIKGKYLVVYEAGKSIPWKINKKGIALKSARFDENKAEDVNFVIQNYGLTKEDIPALNDYEAYIEYIMQVEPKVSKPITIDLRDPKYSQDCYLDEKGRTKIPLSMLDAKIFTSPNEEKLPLADGVMLDEKRQQFGFKVISAKKSETFPTQCPLAGVQVRDGFIHVYEYGKTISWCLDVNGDVQEYAKFVDASRRDVRYLSEVLCQSKDDIENVNSYGLKYVNKENK